MRRAAGIVVDRGAAWLAVGADGRLTAVYSASVGGDDEDGYAERFSSLHAALGTPDSVGRLVATTRRGGPPDGEVEIYVVQANDFDPDRAVQTMTKIAPEQIEEALETQRVADAVALVALQSILLRRGPDDVHPRTIWVGEDLDADGFLGTFSVSWDGPAGHGEGPQHVSLEDALAWAHDRRGAIALRVGDVAYGVPSRPLDDDGEPLPEWRGPAPTRAAASRGAHGCPQAR